MKVFRRGAGFPKESKWSLLKAEDCQGPMVVRRNDSASELLGSAQYRTRVGIAFPLKRPTESGFPDSDESNELYQIEDAVCRRLEPDELALLVLTITGSNVKELVFYARDPGRVELTVAALRSEVTSHELQSYVEDDPDWEVYREFSQENAQ